MSPDRIGMRRTARDARHGAPRNAAQRPATGTPAGAVRTDCRSAGGRPLPQRGFLTQSVWMPVLIVAILAAVAIPALLDYRADAALRRDLEALAAAQATHLKQAGSYATLDMLKATAASGATLRVTRAGRDGYGALAIGSTRARRCGVYAGTAAHAPDPRLKAPGEIRCWGE